VEAIGIPPDDRFQVLQGAGATQVSFDRQYLGIRRDEGFALVQVFLRGGRTEEQKRSFYRALADGAARIGVEPRNLMVVLTENTLADWSFGEGVAQYLEPR
jgi:Tautomerase enzyme